MKIRTLIVDDEYLIVKSLVHILSSMTDRFEVIGTGTDGEQAYSQICSLATSCCSTSRCPVWTDWSC